MTGAEERIAGGRTGLLRLLSDERVQGWAWQLVLAIAIVAAVTFFAHNAAENLSRRGGSFGLGFLWQIAGFDIPFKLFDYGPTNLYGRALLVAFANTILISILAIAGATFLGFLLGVMRLSTNWLVRNLAFSITELIRNTPQLLQIIFWYVAVMQTLPSPRQSLKAGEAIFLNIRGVYMPAVVWADWAVPASAGLLATLVAGAALWRVRTRFAGPARATIAPIGPALAVAGAFAFFASGTIAGLDYPELQGFNFRGGLRITPELVTLWLGLSIYSAVFIGEIVRGAVEGISWGQTEAARSLGLSRAQTLRLVIIPQALRIIIPPMTSQYLNIIKSSSLGAAVAYPELFQIFGGTVLNQSGRAIEVMGILMAIFLVINLATSALMNWYNRHVAIKER